MEPEFSFDPAYFFLMKTGLKFDFCKVRLKILMSFQQLTEVFQNFISTVMLFFSFFHLVVSSKSLEIDLKSRCAMGMESCFLYYSSALIKKLFFSLTHCGFTLKNQLIFTGRVDVYEFILA